MKRIGNLYFHGSRKEKKIALTFDDGPSKETEKVLNILKENNAKATFFIWGQRIKGREQIIKRILKEGHEIANHTYSHKRLQFKSRKFVEKDVKKCDEELKKFKIKTNLFRFPGFKFGITSLIVLRKMNKKLIFADMVSNDWTLPYFRQHYKLNMGLSRLKVIRRTLRKTKPGSILNFHDYLEGIGSHKEIIPLMKEIIPSLKENYKFVTVSELLGFNHY